jgi:hypothetical protein
MAVTVIMAAAHILNGGFIIKPSEGIIFVVDNLIID